MKNVVLDPVHGTEYPGVVQEEDGYAASTDADGKVHKAVAKNAELQIEQEWIGEVLRTLVRPR